MSALRRFLVDFDAPPSGPSRSPTVHGTPWHPMGRAVVVGEPVAPVDALPAVDPAEARIAEAVAAALADAEARHAAELVARDAGFAATLATERASWVDREGLRLAEGFAAASGAIEAALADAAAAVLEPFVAEAAVARAVADLGREIGSLLAGGSGAALSIAGPEDLLDALRSALEKAGVATERMAFAPSVAAEVTVTADSSTIRTRIADWGRSLRRRLGDEP